MGLKQKLLSFERGVHRVSRGFNYIALIGMILMMMLTVTDVFLRRAFLSPIRCVYEIQGFTLLIVTFFTWAYCQMGDGHIKITFISEKLPPRVAASLDVITYTIAVAVYSVMVWQTKVRATYFKDSGAISGELGLVLWPFPIIGAVGVALFVMALVLTLIHRVKEAR